MKARLLIGSLYRSRSVVWGVLLMAATAAQVCPALGAGESGQSSQTACEQISQQLERTRLALDALLKQQNRASEYLAVARELREKDAPRAEVAYIAALRHAEQKVDILLEYLDWQQAALNHRLGDSNRRETERVSAAQEKLGRISALCEAVLAEASVADVARWTDVTLKQRSLAVMLEKEHSRLLNVQTARVDRDLVGLPGTGTAQQLDAVLQSYAESPVLPELSEKLDDLMDEIRHWRACRTQADEPLQLLEVADEPRMIAWLQNFKARLASDSLSPEQGLADYAAASGILARARSMVQGCPELGHLVSDIEQSAVRLKCRAWCVRVAQADEEQEMLRLLLESTSFSNVQLQMVENELLSLRNKLYSLQLRDMQWEKLHVDKEDALSARHQSLAALSLRCWELTVQSAPYINAENEALRLELCNQMTAELGKIKSIYRLDAEIQSYSEGLAELREYDNAIHDARSRFLSEAEARLKSAGSSYWPAYWKGKKSFIPNRWNEEVQAGLREAYGKVMSIDDAELKLVSDRAYNDYTNLKAAIEEDLSEPYPSVTVTLSIQNFMSDKFKQKQ